MEKAPLDFRTFLGDPSEAHFNRANGILKQTIKSLQAVLERMKREEDMMKQASASGAGPSVPPDVTQAERIEVLRTDIEYFREIVARDGLRRATHEGRVDVINAMLVIIRRYRCELFEQSRHGPSQQQKNNEGSTTNHQLVGSQASQTCQHSTGVRRSNEAANNEGQAANNQMKKRPRPLKCFHCNLVIRR